MSIFVEKGWKTGHQVQFDDLAEESHESDPGSLIFVVEEIKHERFERRGDDLHVNMDITLKEALLGFTKELKHLDGHPVEVSANKVIQPGEVIRIEGQGMPINEASDEFGHLYVHCTVNFPETLTEQQIKGFEEFFSKRNTW